MPPTLLLFDIDGTLLLTGGAGGRAMRAAADKLFGQTFTFEGIIFSGNLDPVIFAEAATNSSLEDHHEHHDLFRDTYLAELETALRREAATVESMPGIHDLLQQLHTRATTQQDIVLGLLTGNYRQAAPIKLAAVHIDPTWFTLTAFGDEGSTRPDLVALAMQKYHRKFGEAIAPQRVIVIGDTPRDIHCAKAHQCIAFAVATGKYTVEQLAEAGADIVVPNLADPAPLLDLL